jgi:hypothetical protein
MQGKLRLDGNTDAAFVLHAPCWTHHAGRIQLCVAINVCWGDQREKVCDATEDGRSSISSRSSWLAVASARSKGKVRPL